MPLEAPRLDLKQFPPEAYRHLLQLEGLISKQFDPILYHLIKLRASQINGCAYCLEMHTDEALRIGEKPERMTALGGWHESPLYTDKERAVLAWVDEVTLIAEKHASKDSFDGLKAHFSDDEIGWLILAVVQINSWNRIAISTRAQYERAPHPAHSEKTPEPA
jgi:AhpD family alkylhydroperoxidase